MFDLDDGIHLVNLEKLPPRRDEYAYPEKYYLSEDEVNKCLDDLERARDMNQQLSTIY